MRSFQLGEARQVWRWGITNVPIRGGFTFLVDVIDRFSRHHAGLAVVEHPKVLPSVG